MKAKKLLAAAVLAAVTAGFAAPVLAAPADDLKFSGQMRVRYTDTDGDVGGAVTQYRLRLTATKAVNENITFKARFMQEKNIDATANATASVDQLSLTYKFNDKVSTALVGKDSAWIGNGLLMDTEIEGLQFATKIEDVKLNGFAGRNNGADLAAISAQTMFDKVAVGATYFNNDNTKKNWAVNAAYQFDNVKLAGEYTENTEATTDDSAYYVTATFGAVKKVGDAAYTLGYVKSEANSGVTGYTTLFTPDTADYKAFVLKGEYLAAKNLTFKAEQTFGEKISTGADKDRTRVYMEAKF
jgi:predicted porin